MEANRAMEGRETPEDIVQAVIQGAHESFLAHGSITPCCFVFFKCMHPSEHQGVWHLSAIGFPEEPDQTFTPMLREVFEIAAREGAGLIVWTSQAYLEEPDQGPVTMWLSAPPTGQEKEVVIAEAATPAGRIAWHLWDVIRAGNTVDLIENVKLAGAPSILFDNLPWKK